jgi:outer membrane protein, multidrug efflux system
MKSLLRNSSAGALALLTAGCITSPPHVLSPQYVPGAFTAPITQGAPVWPQAEWWKAFGSDEMTGFIVAAQKDNLDLAAAAARVAQADANWGIAASALFPTIGASGGVTRTGAEHGPSANQFNATLSASYQLNLFGAQFDNLRSADESLKSSQFAQEVVALTVVADTANDYLNVLALRERVDIAQKNIEAAKRILSITQAKVTNGISSNLDLAQQAAQVEGQEAQVPALQESEAEARYALALLLGKLPEGFDVAAKSLDGIVSPPVAPGLSSELLRRRPDVAEAEAALAAAHANLDAARAAFFPSISLTASGGGISSMLSQVLKSSSIGYTLGGSVLETIFAGGERIAATKLASAEQKELVADYRKAVLSAFSDVETSLGQVSSLAEQERLKTEQVTNAAEAFRISEIQYREGVTDLLSVLTAQQVLFTAQDQLVQIKLARIQADIGLYRALGGGWQEAADDATQPIPTPRPDPNAPAQNAPAPSAPMAPATPTPVTPVPGTPGPEPMPGTKG